MKKNFTNINTVLGHILEKHKLSHLFFLESIKQNWVTFDKTIAAHARPVEYDEKLKKLTLKIDNASWKKEFILNKDLLRVKIQNTFRNIEIKNVEIV